MEKNMYSLILIDEVVDKIDALAHTRGTSRSNLINQILADYVSYLTPQKRISQVFDAILSAVEDRGLVRWGEPSATILALKSVLSYRYNPTIRYSVELTPSGERYAWDFKVKSRSQSDALLSRLTVFYELWSQLELSLHTGRPKYAIQGGSLRRSFWVPQDGFSDSSLLGQALGEYLLLFDRAMKICFSAKHGIDMQTYETLTDLYKGYLDRGGLVL